MKYECRYWKRRVDSKEKEGPFALYIEVDINEADFDKKAIEKAKLHVMCDLECTTTAIMIVDPQILIENKWIDLA